MTHRREPDRLTEAFARLPRQQPSEGFTQEVLAALDTRPRSGANSPIRLVWVSVAIVLMTSFLALGYGMQRQRAAERAYQDQVEELRSRYQDLLNEVATVRQEVATPDTRLYLGGDESLDLVLDFSQNPTYAERGQNHQEVRPANWKQ